MLSKGQKIALVIGVVLVVIILVIFAYVLLSSSSESFDGPYSYQLQNWFNNCYDNCRMDDIDPGTCNWRCNMKEWEGYKWWKFHSLKPFRYYGPRRHHRRHQIIH